MTAFCPWQLVTECHALDTNCVAQRIDNYQAERFSRLESSGSDTLPGRHFRLSACEIRAVVVVRRGGNLPLFFLWLFSLFDEAFPDTPVLDIKP